MEGGHKPRHAGRLWKLEKVKNRFPARCQWLMLIILAPWEAEIRRIEVQSQQGQIAHETLS
jgi:hypothetical protein